MRSFFLLTIVILFLQPAKAQVKKFGKVDKNEFRIKNDKKYTEDDAVILFRQYKTHYDYDQITGWNIITKVHERILLKNKDGFDYATKKINLYTSNVGDEEVKIKAATYNLVDDNVVKTKLKKDAIFTQKDNKYQHEKKFTMPNIKEGSIVEWLYTIESPYTQNIHDLVYKTLIPIQYFEAEVSIPEFFHFKYLTTPFFPVKMKEENKQHANIGVWLSTSYGYHNHNVICNVYKLKLKDMEPINVEPYVNNINNYIGKISFELSYIKFPNGLPKHISTTWEDICKIIFRGNSFGGQLKKHKYFEDDLSGIIKTDDAPQNIINKILAFVKQKVRWNEYYQIIAKDGVKKAYKNGSGNVAEINFILIAMLRKSGLEAYPVLASTNALGVPFFPTINGFNYVLTAVRLNDTYVLLDPTEKYAPAGVLPKRILNWEGRLIKKDGASQSIRLFPSYYAVSKRTIKASLNEEQEIKGYSHEQYTGNLGLTKRNKYAKASKEDIIKDYEDQYDNVSVDNIRVSNIEHINKPLKIMMQFNMEDEIEEVGDKLVFSPVLFLKDKENIFKSEKRNFPIYFGYPYKGDYTINISIPNTYKVEKLPDNITLSLPENQGTYTYQIQKTENGISLTIKTNISSSIIPNTMYKELKDFFEKMFNKEHEKVILSRK